jgi:CheY-like chemotaxis protein
MNDYKENDSRLKPKLLFVEDDEVAINIVVKLLKDTYDVDYVKNGEAALIKAKECDYDAFLIDIGLPGNIDGIQTTKELKKIKNNNDKPYIAVTNYALPGDREYLLSEGLTHYISKPFKFKDLIELIEASLKNRKS